MRAFADHGSVCQAINVGAPPPKTLGRAAEAGVNLEAITAQLAA